jgi:predicted dehydrogenase
MCRKKARVVLVGDVGLNLQRADFYVKELDFLISTSYGPGRYDQAYEEGGVDYPVEQVRWTENRNMGEYLRLLADGVLAIKPMIAAVHDIDNAAVAYGSLQSNTDKPLMVLLSYPHKSVEAGPRIHLPTSSKNVTTDKIRMALIGAGGFAKGMHLPNLMELKSEYALRAVVSRTGHNAASTGKRFGADYCTTDYQEVLADKDIDAVIIATRHDKHGSMALEALKAGKHVLLEKPLALEESELVALEAFFADGADAKPVLLTGFNRRFSPYAVAIAGQLEKRTNPMIINYRMNAGYIPLDHWVHGAEGGGRNRGEACHIYDLFTCLTGSAVVSVQASAIAPTTGYFSAVDNFVANLTFEDGSVATLTYTALGTAEFPKESMDIFVDGKVISLDDYRRLSTCGSKQKPLATRTSEKGQLQELVAFAAAVKGRAPWPIPLWQQMQATRMSFEVERLLQPR